MKTLNIIAKIIRLPFRILTLPLLLVIGFVITDWEDKNDIKFFKKVINIWN